MQVLSLRTKLGNGKARLVGIDLLETDGIAGADIFTGDITDPEMLEGSGSHWRGSGWCAMTWRQLLRAIGLLIICAQPHCWRQH